MEELVFKSEEVPFVPIISEEVEVNSTQELKNISELPILPLRNTVLFPTVVLPIAISREKSLKLINDVNSTTKILGVVAQKDQKYFNPNINQIFTTGTIAQIIKVIDIPDNTVTVILHGKSKFKILEFTATEPYFKAKVELIPEPEFQTTKEIIALVESIKDVAFKIIKLSENIPQESSLVIKNIENPVFLINFLCSTSNISLKEKQKLLEIDDLNEKGMKLLELLNREVQLLELKRSIQEKVKKDLDRQHKEFLLQQQIKTLQEELGENPYEQVIKEFKKKAKKKKWSKEVANIFYRELKKLERINPMAAEYPVQYNYLELMLDLPWNEYTEDNFDIENAKKVLDEDHFGLDKVKERILEHLSVLKLKGDLKAPILCLVGPPGVGKTSLGKSIARALNRKYVRISLGGLHDEAEIRGHRRTYIGALPGRIISGLKKAGSSNPVFVLDEIDKVGKDFRGDPAMALLEVLDPEQNVAFHDNYLDIDYDLSKVLFITTANVTYTIHPALLDRMEIIEIPGYITEEKINIAQRHLIPKLIKELGLEKYKIIFTNEALVKIIINYTRESGVRNLERKLSKILRNYALKIASKEIKGKKIVITEEDVLKILGAPEYEYEEFENSNYAGVAIGLAWTATGGEILFVEASLSRGKGNLTITGNVGDVMKESAIIAFEYIKSNYNLLNLHPEVFEKWNVHVHVPEGAVPKDGPSAGITIVTAIASAFCQREIKPYLAMTGEITLRGKLLPVGGIKEKILAAKRGKIKEIVLPASNKKNVDEIQKEYLEGLNFVYFNDIKEVLNYVLLPEKVPNFKVIE